MDNREQPYLNLRLHTLYYEMAMMEYGVAVQFGIGSILLVDKTNAGVTGSYLELISTDQTYEVLVVSYRKVSIRELFIVVIIYKRVLIDFTLRLNQIVRISSRISRT